VPAGDHVEPIGAAAVVRQGTDLSVITYGYEVHRCLDAAERIAADHQVSVEIVDVRSLAPLDRETILTSVRKTSRAMVVYEDNRTYGAGAEIAATIAEEALFDLDAPIVRVGGPDIPAMPYAASLEHFYTEPSPDHLYRAMLDLAHG
jgi:2-oxoisovalerate dehydrogenase E1 component beta subunit